MTLSLARAKKKPQIRPRAVSLPDSVIPSAQHWSLYDLAYLSIVQ